MIILICFKIIVKGNLSKYVKDQNKNRKPNVDSNERNSPKKKIMLIRDSMIKYLRCKNLLSSNNKVKIAAHPGSTKEDMLDCIILVLTKKSDLLVIHARTSDFLNGVKKMK